MFARSLSNCGPFEARQLILWSKVKNGCLMGIVDHNFQVGLVFWKGGGGNENLAKEFDCHGKQQGTSKKTSKGC